MEKLNMLILGGPWTGTLPTVAKTKPSGAFSFDLQMPEI